KIAGPSDKPSDNNIIFLPYWLLSYEEIESLILDRSDSNAPNQSRTLFDLIIKYKRENLEKAGKTDVLDNFTVESPIPYKINDVLTALEFKDKDETQPGAKAGTTKVGPLHDKLTRFIQRLKSKQSDKRLNFLFNSDEAL